MTKGQSQHVRKSWHSQNREESRVLSGYRGLNNWDMSLWDQEFVTTSSQSLTVNELFLSCKVEKTKTQSFSIKCNSMFLLLTVIYITVPWNNKFNVCVVEICSQTKLKGSHKL